jgi:glycosyltransferase involved in cell wall biosynthesis
MSTALLSLLPTPRISPAEPLRIALLAPPWIAVPPYGYGGIESVLALLSDGLVERGHDVALLAAPGSSSSARVVPLLDAPHPDAMREAIYEADHTARAFEVIDSAALVGNGFDVVHDHSGFTAVAMADRIDAPILHTLHGPFTEATRAFYRRHGRKVWLSALSEFQAAQAPRGMRWAGTIPNPIEVDAWPFEARKRDYLLWVGRMSPEKGAHRAIAVARRAGRALVLAGPVQPGQEAFFAAEVEPHVDGDAVRYLPEIAGADKQRLFAEAAGFLMPIRWPEPFGMVMIEALVCGTPVIAFAEGSAPEIVTDGRTGFLVGDEEAMARAVGRLGEIDPDRCRSAMAARYAVDLVVGAYESAYRRMLAGDRAAVPVMGRG